MTSGGAAGVGGIDGSVGSLILRIMPQATSGRDRAMAVTGREHVAQNSEPGAPLGTPGCWQW